MPPTFARVTGCNVNAKYKRMTRLVFGCKA